MGQAGTIIRRAAARHDYAGVAEEQARAEERKTVAAWLRGGTGAVPGSRHVETMYDLFELIAAAIERGAHLKRTGPAADG